MQRPVTDPRDAPTIAPVPPPRDPRSTAELVRDIAADAQTLARKEVELAKREVMEAVSARLVGAASLAGAGLLGLFVLLFLSLGAAAALSLVLPMWAAALVVGGGYALLAVPAAVFGIRSLKGPPLKPEETVRTVKEDVEWARAQLRR